MKLTHFVFDPPTQNTLFIHELFTYSYWYGDLSIAGKVVTALILIANEETKLYHRLGKRHH